MAQFPAGPKGRLLPTLKFLTKPRQTLETWKSAYGDPFFLHPLNGPIVMTGRPDLIRQIFSIDPAMVDVFGYQAITPILGKGSMLMISGDAHRRERKLIMPMFHGERMKQYGLIMQAITIEAFNKRLAVREFEMMDVATDISLEVIVQTVFGGSSPQRIQRLIDISRNVIKKSSPLFFFSPKLQFSLAGISPWDRLVQAKLQLRDALEEEVEDRVRQQAAGVVGTDILSLLLDAKYDDGKPMERQQIFDELGTFLFAGHETTAIAISWAFYHLQRNPITLQKLITDLKSLELQDVNALASLPYLKAVVQETLRVNPIVTDVLRIVKEPIEFAGYSLPAGTALASAIQLVHYDPSLYPEPDQFRPERFLEKTFSASEYFPFGGGHRRCAGAAFATYEMAIVIGTALKQYKLNLLETGPVTPKRRNITMGPSTGIRFRLG